MKDLILVESPTKAKTLDRFLKGKYEIQASFGHISDLPKGKLGIDIENNFAPDYVVPNDKKKVLSGLKTHVKNADAIILATDPDREGEAIAFHLHELLKKDAKNKKFSRIVFHEITEEAIQEALSHPGEINQNLVEAQTARRVLDRIVGYKLSPLLWKKVRRNLSAGRVQSIAVRLIVEREREIGKFDSKKYFRVFVNLHKTKDTNSIQLELVKINGEGIEKQQKLSLYDGEYTFKFTDIGKESAEEIEKELHGKEYIITDLTEKETKSSPRPPFTTSALQQEAFRRLSFSSKKTMMLAQKLYEEGFITYHRTDSYNMSAGFVGKAKDKIRQDFGNEYIGSKVYETKSKVAQEAHEAIRPTSPISQHDEIQAIGRDYARLYELIYKRTLASLMADAIFTSTRLEVEAKASKNYIFQANGKILKFPGYLKMYYYEEADQILPKLTVGEKLEHDNTNISEHSTTPPPRYNEASLIASLESHEIGRPSTYAPIISTIFQRLYIEKDNNRLIPTPIGIAVNDFLVQNFSNIDDIPFTAEMENTLDKIANGEQEWQPMIKTFYEPFEKTLVVAEGQKRIEIESEKTDKKCPECQADVVIKMGRFGKFYACTRFPDCKYTAPYVDETEYVCPKDGGKVIVKKTKRGKPFFGCGNYPKCDFAAWNKTELLKKINGEIPLDSPKPQKKTSEKAN